MKDLFESLSLDGFHLFVIAAGWLVLFLNWSTIQTDLKNKQLSGVLLGLIALSLIFVPFLETNKPRIESTLQKLTPSATPEPTPFMGRNDSLKTIDCATSSATGSAATKVFPIEKLPTDGKTDAYPAIQKAIHAAGNAGGGIVKLPAGTFIINGHIAMRSNVVFEGEGPKTVIKAGPNFLKTSPALGYSILSSEGAKNVTIRNFTADHSGNVLDGNKIDRFISFVIDVNNHSKNVVVNGVYVRNPFAFAIMIQDTDQFCVYNNNTQVSTNNKYDQLDGIHVLNATYGDVRNNYVDQGFANDGDDGLAAHTIAGITHDVTFANNTVRGGKGGAGMQLALTNKTDEIYNIVIQNNEFWGSPRGIRTGYYGGPDGSVHDVLIGGAENKGNYIHDNIFNNTTKEDVVNIYGNGMDPYNITVSDNYHCKAGIIAVGKGKNNIVKNNSECKK